MRRQREVELGPGATGYCITRSWWPQRAGCIPAGHRGQLAPSPTPSAGVPGAEPCCCSLGTCSIPGFFCPRTFCTQEGRLKVARGSKAELGAGFSISRQGGVVLPDRLPGGNKAPFVQPKALLRSSTLAPGFVFLQLCSCLPSAEVP